MARTNSSVSGVRFVVALALAASFLGASCGQSALGILPGIVNDPANVSLRRAILRFGTDRMCAEMTKRSMPLRLREDDPSTGRFFTTQCVAQELGQGHLAIQFTGFGYMWTNLTERLAFDASGAIQYETDFLMDGSTMYVFFRHKNTTGTAFRTRFVERPQMAAFTPLPLASGGQNLGEAIGAQIMKSEIKKGFTVVRDTNGSAEFGLGVVEKGTHTSRTPFKVSDSGKRVLLNDRSELHKNQRDFVGPIEVGEGGRLSVAFSVEGAAGIDVFLFPRGVGEGWLQAYTTQAAPPPLPGAPLLDEAVVAGNPLRRTLNLPPGLYYVVLDHTATAGRTMPQTVAHDDRAALVSYGIADEP